MGHKNTSSNSEKRRAKRIPAPVGTTVFLRNSSGSLAKIGVKDISAVGLLVSGYDLIERYPINTSINNIIINIPQCKLSANSRTCLLIESGKVVRSFIDRVSGTVCYGIEFVNDSYYTKKKLESLVNRF